MKSSLRFKIREPSANSGRSRRRKEADFFDLLGAFFRRHRRADILVRSIVEREESGRHSWSLREFGRCCGQECPRAGSVANTARSAFRLLTSAATALLISLAAFFAFTPPASAAESVVKHRLMFFEYGKGPNRLVELDADGKVIWEHKPPSIAVIFEALPNGNVLYAYGGQPTGVREVTRKGEEVWNYVSKCPQVLGCQRLANGNTLVAEQGPCRAVEVNPKGEVVHVTPLKTSHESYHLQVRNIHKLANGNILAAHEGEGAVREVDPAGKVVWEYTGVENAGDAQRLPNGNTLISCGTQKRVVEVTLDKKIAWEFTARDAPDLNITWVSSIQRLKNGHLIVGNFLRGQEGKGAHAFEVTRDKKVVWKWDDHSFVSSLTTVRVLGDN